MNKRILCELVSTGDPGYIKWVRGAIRVKREYRSEPIHDNSHIKALDRKITIEHKLWESVVRKAIMLNFKEYPNRVLKFRDFNNKISYFELDFITKLDNSLLICEIKLKNICDQNKMRSYLKKGWKQVWRAYSKAKFGYQMSPPLLIVVDMSHILGLDYSPDQKRPDYDCLSGLESKSKVEYVKSPSPESFSYKGFPVNILWLNSEDIAKVALENNFLIKDDLERLSELVKLRIAEDKREYISYIGEEKSIVTNPFSKLKRLKL